MHNLGVIGTFQNWQEFPSWISWIRFPEFPDSAGFCYAGIVALWRKSNLFFNKSTFAATPQDAFGVLEPQNPTLPFPDRPTPGKPKPSGIWSLEIHLFLDAMSIPKCNHTGVAGSNSSKFLGDGKAFSGLQELINLPKQCLHPAFPVGIFQ